MRPVSSSICSRPTPRWRISTTCCKLLGPCFAHRCPERLEPWLQQAVATGIPELRSFVGGIERDYSAVANALQYSYSQGPVEGQITRLKLLKRAMYGGAKADLLEWRLLYRL